MILGNCGDEDVRKASGKLDSLRASRNQADYHLNDLRPEKKPNVILDLKSADDVMRCIEQCFAGQPKAAVHDGIRKYAKEQLKMHVAS